MVSIPPTRPPDDDLDADDGAVGDPGETQDIARAAKAGDEQRFAELYERIAPALYTWPSLRIRPVMCGAIDPQDVVQEVWCRAWKGFGRFDPQETPFRSW